MDDKLPVVFRRICALSISQAFYSFPNFRMQKISDIFSCVQSLTDKCRTDFEHRGVNETYRFRQFLFIHGKARTGVNDDLVLFDDTFRLIPTVEACPIIRTDDKMKFTFGIRFAQFLQCMYVVALPVELVTGVSCIQELPKALSGWKDRILQSRFLLSLFARWTDRERIW